MIQPQDIRSWALSLPEVEEGTHFRLPSFKVRDKGFATLQKGDTHLLVSVDEATATQAAAADPEACEAVWRSGHIFVGLRVDLGNVPPERVRDLLERAWRNKAPKRLLASYDVNEQS